MKGGSVELSLPVLLMILIICTNASTTKAAILTRRTITGSWNDDMPEFIADEEHLMESNVSQILLQQNNYITYPALNKQAFCTEGIYGNCLGKEMKIGRPCNAYDRCRGGSPS
ncbi:hypothetical protein JCGZ_25575 [Jatropha curcas]|uniref:Rapid ALkalinization Factor n=1 Tax=Jatropha curcas TaxID=180498 RepID=A0A067JXM1_JATCU|nr:hypothetical protein JCGZ_25575 [Jatropha curcas]